MIGYGPGKTTVFTMQKGRGMGFRRIGVAICIIVPSFVGGCSLFHHQQSCDSPETLGQLRALIMGQENNAQLSQAQANWLERLISITVLDQAKDETGRHLRCSASMKVNSALLPKPANMLQAIGIASLQIASVTVRYVVSTDAGDTETVLLTPMTDDESNLISLIQMDFGGTFSSIGKPAPKPESPTATSAAPSRASDVTPPDQNPQAATPAFEGGNYHRSNLSSSDMTITAEGDQWRISIVGASIAQSADQASADCHLQAVGPLQGDKIIAKPVPFKDEDEEVTADDIKDIGDTVVQLTPDGAEIVEAPTGGICGQNSDLTGKYLRPAPSAIHN